MTSYQIRLCIISKHYSIDKSSFGRFYFKTLLDRTKTIWMIASPRKFNNECIEWSNDPCLYVYKNLLQISGIIIKLLQELWMKTTRNILLKIDIPLENDFIEYWFNKLRIKEKRIGNTYFCILIAALTILLCWVSLSNSSWKEVIIKVEKSQHNIDFLLRLDAR